MVFSSGLCHAQAHYIVEEIQNLSEHLEINTYVLYPKVMADSHLSAVVYPNPVDDILNVKITGSRGNTISYHLIDASGKSVSVKEQMSSQFIINMKGFITGVYILVLQDASSRKSFKIIKK